MAALADYEQLILRQTEALRELADREQEARQALSDANIDLFDKCRVLCDNAFEDIMSLDAGLRAMEPELTGLSISDNQREHIRKLAGLRDTAIEKADAENKMNQQVLSEVVGELGKHIKHLRTGRKAMAGYGRGLKLGKPPSIISGDV